MAKPPRIKVEIKDTKTNRKWLAELRKAAGGGAFVKVGLLGGSKDRRPGEPLTNVEIGVVHEFGAPSQRIPERSFIRRAFDRNLPDYDVLLEKFARAIYDGKMPIERALGLIGAKVSADVKNTVTRGPPIPPPNAPYTLKIKEAKRREGSAGPVRTLIDTGRMIGSIAWQVFLGKRKGDSGGGEGG